MKKLLLLSLSLLLMTMADAQLKRQKSPPGSSSDTTWQHTDGQATRKKVSNGDVMIHAKPGKYNLYATYKNKKITGYYAIDAKGRKILASYSAKSARCIACITVEDGINYCYDIDCNDLPKPRPKKTSVKVAN